MSDRKTINIACPSFLGNEKTYLLDTLESGWISSIGPYLERFEQAFAKYHGVKHAVATHNGTIALHLALAASGIGAGDEVIVPDFTFVATANSVRYCNATPILTDIDPGDWNLAPDAVLKNIRSGTRAIIPVHLYGNPAQISELMELSRKHNLIVIEDCAEALGAEFRHQRVGTFGDIGCFSFFGNKIITTGEGGMCITNCDDLAERMRMLRDHGMNRSKKYWYDALGFNYRMTNMQAAVGLAQLEQIDYFLTERDHIFELYQQAFRGNPMIMLQDHHGQRSVNWMFTIRLNGITEPGRDAVINYLRTKHIDTRPAFYPIHRMSFYQTGGFFRALPENSIRIASESLSLPTYIGLLPEEIEYIAGEVNEAIKLV